MFLFNLINRLTPKHKRLICLTSFPDYDDQVRALVKFIIENKPDYKIVILTDNAPPPPFWAKHDKISHHKKKSISGIFSYMRSKFVFFTHGCFSSAKTVSNQTCVNIWHGMPIKKIGRYIDENHRTSNGDYLTATSDFFVDIMSYAFRMPKGKILNTGLPRNDILLSGVNDNIRKKLGNSDEILVWLPTYRKSVIGEIREDGEVANNIFNMPDLDVKKLNEHFKSLNITAIVKPHPMAMKHSDNNGEYSNIKLIDENWLLENETTLYEVLAQSDMLITDISSVLIDYLLLELPIICHFPDMDSYKGSRGLIWDFNPKDYGIDIVTTQTELLDGVKKAVQGEFATDKLIKLKNLSHDSKSDFSESLIGYVLNENT